MAREEIEEDADVPLDPRLEPLPVGAIDESVERRDVEVLLHVDSEEMGGPGYAGHRSGS